MKGTSVRRHRVYGVGENINSCFIGRRRPGEPEARKRGATPVDGAPDWRGPRLPVRSNWNDVYSHSKYVSLNIPGNASTTLGSQHGMVPPG